jgi:hypothetical protein
MNHLLIGLGGTGIRVIRSFRKSMYLAYRDHSPDGLVLDYMLVDSDASSFRDSDPSWMVLGQSVQLPKKNQLLIAQANLISVIDNLQAYDDLQP